MISAQAPFNVIYENSLADLKELDTSIKQARIGVENFDPTVDGRTESDLDLTDLVFAMTFGVLGGVFSSNESIKAALVQVHDNPSKSRLGNFLKHNGDHIDLVPTDAGHKFLNRAGESTGIGFHRVLRGHDVFSLRSDNPFVVLGKQSGVINGIIKVFKHLLADTFSKQGLPIPFHSFFDFRKGETLSNWLIEMTQQTRKAVGSKVNDRELFGHLFAIRMQDILATGLTWGLCVAYVKARQIDDEVRSTQFRVVAYASNVFTHAAIGVVRTGGVPYISWPSLLMLLKELFMLFKANYAQIRKLERKTEAIIRRNRDLELQVFKTGKALPSYSNRSGYIQEIEAGASAFDMLTDVFEGED